MHLLLDNAAREWLALIEERKKELERVLVELREESKRRAKLRSDKFRQTSDQLLEGYKSRKSACEQFIETSTREFFQAVFGILEGIPAALQDSTGRTEGALIVSEMTARQLSDGTGVFTISGASLDADVLPGLPRSDYLLAQESTGQKFVPLA